MNPQSSSSNSQQSLIQVIEKAIQCLNEAPPPEWVKEIKLCKAVVQIQFCLQLSNGECRDFQGWRVVHSDYKGTRPTKGGIRYADNVTPAELETLAMLMSLKCAITGLPFGGAKAGLVINPHEYKEAQGDLELITRRFTQELMLRGFVDPYKDVPAPDIGTRAKEMGWIMDAYRQRNPQALHAPGCVTGKPVGQGGIDGRKEATGRGIQYILQEFFRHQKDKKLTGLSGKLAKKRVIIQGLGNVGYHTAKLLQEEDGAVIVAIAEWDGGLINENGLAVEEVKQYMDDSEHHGVRGYPGETFVEDSRSLLEKKADILILAAREDQITKENADRIKARLIVEGANAPITMGAADKLESRGCLVIPDLLANVGGVTVSYFEWAKNLGCPVTGSQGDELKGVQEALRQKMSRAYEEVSQTYWQNDKVTNWRTAAYVVALQRILAGYSGT